MQRIAAAGFEQKRVEPRAVRRDIREDCSRLLLGSPRYVETRAGPVVPSFRPRNQLMMSVNSNAASFEPVRLTIAVVDEQDCVRMRWEVR